MRDSFGVCEWCLPVRGTTLFKKIKECGITSFQVDTGAYEEGIPTIFPEIQESYLQAAQETEIELCCTGNNSLCQNGMVYPKMSPKYDIAKEIVEKSIIATAGLHIDCLMLPSMFDSEIKDEDGFQNTASLLKWACQFAADKGITISSENILTAEENLRLLECVNEENFKLAFDTQNPSGFKGANGPAILKELVQYVNIVHIKDGIGSALGSVHIGEGDSDFRTSIEILKEAGFDGPVISENGYKKSAFYKTMGDPFKAMKEDVRRYAMVIR